MMVLVPLVFTPGDEFWRSGGAAQELEAWLCALERATGQRAVVAADAAGLEMLTPSRRERALRVASADAPSPEWLPPGGLESLTALAQSPAHGPVVMVNPRLAPLSPEFLGSFIKEGGRDDSPLVTARTRRDHPSQVRIHVLIKDVALAHILDPWPSGLGRIAKRHRGVYVATRPFPFSWHARFPLERIVHSLFRLRTRGGHCTYAPLHGDGATGKFPVFIREGDNHARFGVPRAWVLDHPLLRQGESVAGIVCPSGRLDRRFCLAARASSRRLTLRARLPRTAQAAALFAQAKTPAGVHTELTWTSGTQAGLELPELAPEASAVSVCLFRESQSGESEMVLPVVNATHSLVMADGRMMSPDGSREYAGRQDFPELLSFDGAAAYLPQVTSAHGLRETPRGFVLDDTKSILVRSGLDRLHARALERALAEGDAPLVRKEHASP